MPILSTIYPNRIVSRYVAETENAMHKLMNKQIDAFCRSTGVDESAKSASLQNLKIKKTSFALSSQTKSKIRDSVQLLHEFSKPRTVWASSKKPIYNFRAAFITLTLPSPQRHDDKQLKKCLNNFLTTLRQTYNVKNYVWKAELQQNSNIHFHIITDTYIHHRAVRYYWNKALETLGYITAYRKQMEDLTLKEYAEKRGVSIGAAYNGFAYGVATKWSNPPTEQAVSLQYKKQIAHYLGKYLTKPAGQSKSRVEPESKKTHISIAELVRVRKFGRVWGRSQSLSKLKLITRWNWENLLSIIRTFPDYKQFFKVKEHEYCKIYYFNFDKISSKFRHWINRILVDQGTSYAYPFPT